MSNKKSILVLLLLVLLLGLANLAVRRPTASARVVSGAPLVASASSEDWTRIEVFRQGLPPTELERSDGWRLTKPFSGAADGRVIAKLLDCLAVSEIADVIADSDLVRLGRSLADFGLVDPVVSLRLSGRAGERTVSFGVPTPAADGVYARVSDVSAVLVVSLDAFAAIGSSADSFRSRSLVRTAAESIASFDVKQGLGVTRTFAKRGKDWKTDEGVASRREIEKFVSDLVSTLAVEFVWPTGSTNEQERISASLLSGYGLDPENALTVTLRDSVGNGEQILFGKPAGENLVYVAIQNCGAIVTVPVSLRDVAARSAERFLDSRLFPYDRNAVSRIALADGEVSYVLSREKDLGWRLESPIAAPADGAVVEDLLDRVLALSSSDAVADKSFAVSLQANGESLGVPREKVLADRRLDDLRSCEIVRIEPSQVKRLVQALSLKGGTRSRSVVYGRELKTWSVETEDDESSESAVLRNVESVCGALNPLKAVRIEKLKVQAADLDGYGLGRPYLTLAVDQDREDAVRRNILIGDRTEGGRFATVGSSDAVFVVSEEVVDSLVSPLTED